MFVLVVGAGRVGASVARDALAQGHTVSVLDRDAMSHEQLDQGLETSWEEAGGQFTVGAALESSALIAAGIEQANVFVAATNGDNTNLVVAQIAEQRFSVGKVIARVLDPARAEWYGARGGIQTICGTSRAIELVEKSIADSVGGA
ncbi:MAG: NAD-binding protein [Actinomycetes bacterium]